MQRTNIRLVFLCVLSIGTSACQEGLHIDGFDGSLFDDAGDAGGTQRDAATNDPDEDGGADGTDGGASTDGGAGGDRDSAVDAGPLTPDKSLAEVVPGLFATALCDALADCYDSAAFRDDVLGGHDCVALNENVLANGELQYLSASIDAGLVRVDLDKLNDCTSDIRALGCDARASRLPPSCKAAFAGTVLIAGECTINLDCNGEAFCDKGEIAMCPGVCWPLQVEDAPCNQNDDNQCKDGLVCKKGACRPLRSIGQSCGGTDQTGCEPGLECGDLGTGDGDQCAAVGAFHAVALGDDCNAIDALCEPGLVCESVSGEQGVCAKPVGRDASCKRAQPNQCPPGQYCDAVAVGESGTCVDAPDVGEACRTRTPLCAEGNVCVANVCRAIHANGGTCSGNSECYSGVCDGDVCEAPLQCDAP